MNSVIIVTTHARGPYYKLIKNSLEEKGVKVYISDWYRKEINQIIRDKKLTPGKTIIHARSAGKSISNILSSFERKGFRVINKSTTIDMTSNKYKATIVAKNNRIRVPDSYLINKKYKTKIIDLLNKYPYIVLKPLQTPGKGRGVYLLKKDDTNNMISRILNSIPDKNIHIQEYVHHQKLVRVIVLDGKAIRSYVTYKKGSHVDKKKTSDLKVHWYKSPPNKVISLAEKTARVFACDICYVDFFETKDKEYIFNEINTASGFTEHDRVLPSPVYKIIADFLYHSFPKKMQ